MDDTQNKLGESAPKGPAKDLWLRQYLNPLVADFLAEALMYAPMAMRSAPGAMAARDAVMANRLTGFSPIEHPGVTASVLSRSMRSTYPNAMRNYAKPDESAGMVAYPDEVGFWARQVPANISDAEAMARPRPLPRSGDPYRDAMLSQLLNRRRDSTPRGHVDNRPFDVIPGGKVD